jgi:hypothetical protein
VRVSLPRAAGALWRGGVVEFSMADLLRTGAAWLADQLKRSAGTLCAYKRGNNTAQLTASISRSMFESQGTSGVVETWESRDYLVAVEELPYGEPRRGDLIIEEIKGVATFYEVTTPRGVPVFHWADAFQAVIRIHTKQVDRDITYIVTEQGDEIVIPLAAD